MLEPTRLKVRYYAYTSGLTPLYGIDIPLQEAACKLNTIANTTCCIAVRYKYHHIGNVLACRPVPMPVMVNRLTIKFIIDIVGNLPGQRYVQVHYVSHHPAGER